MARQLPIQSRTRGFTLVELLVVIAIVVVLGGLSMPAISSMMQSGSFDQTLGTLNGTLEQAREYAVAQNTYVWVTLVTDGTNIHVAVIASPDGTDSSTTWSGTPAAGSSALVPISKTQTFNLTTLTPSPTAGTLNLATPPTSWGSGLNSTASFQITPPGQTNPLTFNYALQFTPSGEARIQDGAPIDVVEFAVQPQKGPGVVNAKNGAVIQVNGLTGQTRVYRQ